MKGGASGMAFAIAAALALGPAGSIFSRAAAEPISVSVSKIKDLNLRIYGFVETDFIADTTQGFTEEQYNTLVPVRTVAGADNFAGQHHRTQFSVRDSRLGLGLTLPKTDAGLQSEAVIELDFLGNNAPNTVPGTAAGTQSERDFYNNPAVRVRHAFMNVTYNAWNAKVGQTWSLLGWQPYYFPGETIVQPDPGQLYRRFAQARLTHTLDMGSWTLESAADAARPAEVNSGNPELHAGLRLASTQVRGASSYGAGTSMVGLSVAVSGALIPIETDGIGNPTGQALAFDFLVPIIPSSDGKDRSNNLVWVGEVMGGSGVGGLEYSGLTFGVPAISAATPNAGSAVDSGIAGIDAAGNAELIRCRAFRTNLQYTLPGGKWALSGGYAQVEGRNLDRFSFTTARNIAIAPKIQFGYVGVLFDPWPWLRAALEVNQAKDTYNDPANRFAINNRFQLTTYFVF